MTRQDLILNAIVAAISAEMAGTAHVGRNIMRPSQAPIPVVSVSLTADSPTVQNMAFIDWEMTATTTIALFGKLDQMDSLFLAARASIHRALMRDQTLNLGFVQSIRPDEMSEPEFDNDGDRPSVLIDLDWLVKYRTKADSIEG